MLEIKNQPPRTQRHIGRQGALRLHFAKSRAKTILRESYSHAPLQVMRPIEDDHGGLQIFMLSPTGGVVQGDHYTIEIRLDAGTHALITTIAANKVYKMPDGLARQTINITVGEGAILEFVPDALILFKDSELEQTVHITLEKGALCIFQESVMGGRISRGEILQFRRYYNHIEVCDERGLLLYDRADYQPQPADIHQIGLLDGFAIWGSWYAFGDFTKRGIDLQQFCHDHSEFGTDAVFGSLSTLHRNGLSARLLTNRLESIETAFHQLRHAMHRALNIPYSRLRK
ncbi:MAG: urease accessory protein UreD [Aggregatilineales bacterium]